MNEVYLSSSGRGARRGRAPAAVQGGGTALLDFDDDDAGGGSGGGGDYLLADDFDLDAGGQSPEDPDYRDNWGIQNYQ
jgi:hypothetical protein